MEETLALMARSIRIEYPGAFYHVMARGNRREAIYRHGDDRRFFLQVLAEACGKCGWRVHAWVLMNNHYHLLLQTPEANLVEGMKWLQNTYTRRFNVRHKLWGRVFGDRYKSVLVEGEGRYYETLLDYIHLNPARAGLVDPDKGQSVLDYPWSSVAGGYAVLPRKRAPWFAAADGLIAFGLADSASGRRKFVERLDRRILSEGMEKAGAPLLEADVDARYSHLRRGWYWGSQVFGERMLKLGEQHLRKARHRSYRSSLETQAHGEVRAEETLREGLAAAGLSEAGLDQLPGSDLRKVVVGAVIWERTTVGMKWIAQKLEMKSAANASHQIRRLKTGQRNKEKVPKALKAWARQSIFVA
jgi:REP element-mobilizing transposase RayT